MARRRRYHRKGHSHKGGMMSWVGKLIAPASFAVAFTGQVAQKDIANYGMSNFQGLPSTQKLQFLANSVVSHTTGYSPFSQYGNPGITFNPTGPVNKYTGLGVLSLIASEVVPSKWIPKSTTRKLGKGLLLGGIIGGFLDPGSGARSGGQSRRGAPGGLNAIGANTGGRGSAGGAYIGSNMGY